MASISSAALILVAIILFHLLGGSILRLRSIYSPFVSRSYKSTNVDAFDQLLRPIVLYVCSETHQKECNAVLSNTTDIIMWVENSSDITQLLKQIPASYDNRLLIVIVDFTPHGNGDTLWYSLRPVSNRNALYAFNSASSMSQTLSLHETMHQAFFPKQTASYPASTFSVPNQYSINIILASEDSRGVTAKTTKTFHILADKLIKNLRYIGIHTYTHTHTHVHTHTYIYTHTHIHTYIHTHTQTHTQTHTHTLIHT